jgi:hypothetical protein
MRTSYALPFWRPHHSHSFATANHHNFLVKDQSFNRRHNSPGRERTLLRVLADLGFSLGPTEVDENPLPRFACVALLARCCFCSRFARPRRAENGSPCPVRADACTACGISNPSWLLNCVEGKVSTDTDNDARKTCRQIYAHDQSSESPSGLSVKLAAFSATRRDRFLRFPPEATSCGAPRPI